MDNDATEKAVRNRIGERLKLVRGNTSQTEYANLFGVTTNTIGRYERGERTPDAEFIFALCKETGVNPRWLILGEEPMHDAEASQERPRLKAKDLRKFKSIDDIPHEGLRTAAKGLQKALRTRGQEWEQVPEWVKEEMDELYERNEGLERELDEARAEVLKAKDEAINAQSMALRRTDTLVDNIMKALEDKGLMYTTEELFEAMKSCGTPAELEKLIKQGRKK